MRGAHRAPDHPAAEPIIGGMETPPPFDPSVTAHPDPEATLSGPPEPWDFLPQPVPRDGPPWWMTEMIAAEPALAGRVLRRLGCRCGAAPACPACRRAWRPRAGRRRPGGWRRRSGRALEKGEPVVVTGCGTSEHGAQAFAAIVAEAAARGGIRGAGQPGSVAGGAGLRGGPGPAAGRAHHRDQPRGRDGGHDRGARRGGSRGGAHGRHDRPRRRRRSGAPRSCWRPARSTGAGATRSATSRRSSRPWRSGRRSRASRATPTRPPCALLLEAGLAQGPDRRGDRGVARRRCAS